MTPGANKLSAIDAFFVAYQESSGVLMQLGVEVELKGHIERNDLEQALKHIVQRWPPLGQRLHKDFYGLSWEGKCRTSEMLQTAASREALAKWRNRPLNPFFEPPFQVLWIDGGGSNLLAFRAHHAVVDGEGFFAVCVEAVRALVKKDLKTNAADFASAHRLFNRLSKREAFQNLERLRQEARGNQSARVAMRSCTPGDISIIERNLDKDDFHELQRQASKLNIAPGWLCAAGWMKAIHAWNLSCGRNSTSSISIEVPISLRRSRDNAVRIGNWISPLTLQGDAMRPLEELATDLKQQIAKAVRQRMHLALPILSSPAKFLPWSVFRKLAASPELTGFATSHFAWFEQSQAIHEEVSQASAGALQIVNQQIYTPVCLHMGAAVSVLAWPERAQIFLTYRLTALSTSEAQTMLDLMVQELDQRCLRRPQVAV